MMEFIKRNKNKTAVLVFLLVVLLGCTTSQQAWINQSAAELTKGEILWFVVALIIFK